MELITYAEASHAMDEGKLVARSDWNGKGMFAFKRPEDSLSADFIINKVKSLPQALKDYYIKQFTFNRNESESGLGPDSVQVLFSAYYCLKMADGTIMNGWVPNSMDLQAKDWIVLD